MAFGKLWCKIRCLASVVIEVLFQKLWMIRLPPLHKMPGNVRGKTVIVTGPTSGIGRETAAYFARKGAHVVLACRDLGRGDRLREELLKECQNTGVDVLPEIEVMQLDISSCSSVWHFVEEWGSSGRPVHVLINNAGIFNMAGPRQQTVDEFEAHMGTNHLGPYLLTLGLLQFLQKGARQSGAPSRVVHVSSKLQEAGAIHVDDPYLKNKGAYSPLVGYAQSKLAQVLFAYEMQRRLTQSGTNGEVLCCALHPGEVLTNVARSLSSFWRACQKAIMPIFLLTPQQGARCSVHCAVSDKAAAEIRPGRCYFDSNCTPVRPNKQALDEGLRNWLWEWSAAAVGLPESLDLQA